MIERLKLQSEFSRNVVTLMTGTTIAQAITVAISPILTRIYTPEDFGLFALFMAISAVVSVIATGKYEMAIMLPKKDGDAINIMVLSFLVACFISLFLLFVIFIFNAELTKILNTPDISSWLYLIPLTVFLTGVYQSLNYWFNRKKMYQGLANNKVIQSSSTAGTNLGLGVNGFGVSGLIMGVVVGQVIAILFLAKKKLKNNKNVLALLNIKKIIVLAKKYKDFPKFNAPHALMGSASSNMPVFIISYFFSSSSVGFFSLANRVLMSPARLVAYPFGQVFLQKLTHNKNIKENETLFFNSSLFKLLGYSFFPFLLLFIFSPNIFGVVFGEVWVVAGEYTQILIPMIYLTFVGSILSNVVLVYNQQKTAFKIEVINISVKFLSMLVGGISENIELGLILYSLSGVCVTVYRISWYKSIIK